MSENSASLVARMAAERGIEPAKFLGAVKTAFAAGGENSLTTEALIGLLLVCDHYRLDPFTKQIFAFRSRSGEYVPMVSADGFMAIANRNPSFGGLEIRFSDRKVTLPGVPFEVPESCECIITRTDRPQPIRVQEFIEECFMPSSPVWKARPRHMLSLKAIKYAVRVAFGITGLYDRDDAALIDAAAVQRTIQSTPKPAMGEKRLAAMVESLSMMGRTKPNGWELAQGYCRRNLSGGELEQALEALALRRAESEASDEALPEEGRGLPDEKPDADPAQANP